MRNLGRNEHYRGKVGRRKEEGRKEWDMIRTLHTSYVHVYTCTSVYTRTCTYM